MLGPCVENVSGLSEDAGKKQVRVKSDGGKFGAPDDVDTVDVGRETY